jgi:protein tyrosine phosphatase
MIVVITINSPTLVLDSADNNQLPLGYRTTQVVLNKTIPINTIGFNHLKIIGSAQFSAQQLQAIIENIHHPIIIVDLRQESHGFINGNAVSWYGRHNWANQNKSTTQIVKDEAARLMQVRQQKFIALDKIRKNNEKATNLSPIIINIKTVQSEAQLAQQFHENYDRIYVNDHMAPNADAVDQFIKIVQHQPKNTWIYVHCLGGSGRTTTFMMMYDTMHNAKQVSLIDIMQRQMAIGGIDLLTQALPDAFHAQYRNAEVNFIKQFYKYCKSNQDNFRTTWSQWLTIQPKFSVT